MFGYVTVNREELKVKDWKRYQAFYCGICQELKERHTTVSRITLTYDMTFLAILLTGLYESPTEEGSCRCAVHPFQKHPFVKNEYTAYAADMNLLLSYYNLMDNWYDEKSAVSFTAARLLRKEFLKVCARYPRQDRAVRRYMNRLIRCEREHSRDIDKGAGLTGQLMGEIFVCRQDVWAPILRRLGFFLGKFIYLMDAFDDMEKDAKSGNYNPWRTLKKREDFMQISEQILTMMMSECAKEFEKLPILEDVDILRNVLYSGIWTKYEIVKRKYRENN
ncbi:MAG: DUF5685 family protein [Ruminococcus sp.]|jgi:hypothetical protein